MSDVCIAPVRPIVIGCLIALCLVSTVEAGTLLRSRVPVDDLVPSADRDPEPDPVQGVPSIGSLAPSSSPAPPRARTGTRAPTASADPGPAALPTEPDAVRGPATGRRPRAEGPGPGPAGSADASARPWVPIAGAGGAILVAGALFHRLGREEMLDNPVRARIHDLVVDRPGGTATDYARQVDVDRTTARYHLEMLERFDFVLSERLRGRRRFFENHGRVDATTRRLAAHLRNGTTRRLVRTVLAAPGLGCGQLARRVGISRSAVYRKVDALQTIGALRRVTVEEGTVVRPAPDRRPVLSRLVEALEDA